jgi:cytochrome c-type biogenesis protein CcmE
VTDLDLSPRPAPPRKPGRTKRRLVPMLVLGLVVVAGGVIVTKFLGSAVDYYCNVDEVGVRSGCEEGRRLRVQGTVDRDSIVESAGETDFTISFRGVTMPVHYSGRPGGIFKECEPVVVHGVVRDGVLVGDDVDVKHDNKYIADNPDRIEAAEDELCADNGG